LANPSKTAESVPTSGIETTSKQKPPSKEALAPKLPVSSLPRSSDQKQRPSPSKREQETKLPQIAASAPAPSSKNKLVENKPAEKKPVEIAQTLPAQNKLLNPTPPSLNSNPPQPTTPSPVDLEKEKPSITLKQPEPPLARTPVVTVSFDPYPSIRMPKAEKSKKSQQGKSLQMGRLVTRVDPVYPEEARQQGVEGTARVHAIFNRDGSIQSVISLSGPPSLMPAAMNAVRQWRYSQTILGGQPMETEEDVTVLFRLTNSAAKN
jgi:TonB family protein